MKLKMMTKLLTKIKNAIKLHYSTPEVSTSALLIFTELTRRIGNAPLKISYHKELMECGVCISKSVDVKLVSQINVNVKMVQVGEFLSDPNTVITPVSDITGSAWMLIANALEDHRQERIRWHTLKDFGEKSTTTVVGYFGYNQYCYVLTVS